MPAYLQFILLSNLYCTSTELLCSVTIRLFKTVLILANLMFGVTYVQKRTYSSVKERGGIGICTVGLPSRAP